jgi:hypothetical protein
MNARTKAMLLVAPLLVASCNGSCQNQQIVTNAMPLEVSDAFGGTTANVLYTTVTVCDANSNCQTINNIQVDTGSGGLRIFKQALTVGLTQVPSGQGSLGVCQTFASGSAWGPVQTATVKLASEPAITIPVQVIDSTFGMTSPPSPCNFGVFGSPMSTHANGILGIDVGAPDSGVYFKCQATSCSELMPSVVVASQRVTNPVLALPSDNNGVIVNLPNVPDNGQATAYGNLILGIGTTWNNDPKTFSTNPIVTVSLKPNDPVFASTTADGVAFSLFAADTGSNAFFFTDPTITRCPSIFNTILTSGWYCPGTIPGSNPPINGKNFAVSVTGSSGPNWNFQVWIRDTTTLVATGNLAFNDLGFNLGTSNTDLFIAGLPFFYGKQVYLGYASYTGSLGTPPLYGYALR